LSVSESLTILLNLMTNTSSTIFAMVNTPLLIEYLSF